MDVKHQDKQGEESQDFTKRANPKQKKEPSFFAKVGFVAVLILILLIAWQTIDILLLIFAGVLLAIFLRSLSYPLIKKVGLSNNVAMTIVLGLLIGISLLTLVIIAPTISEQMGRLIDEMPTAWAKIENLLETHLNWSPNLSHKSLQQIFPSNKQLLSHAANFFSTTFGILGSFFVFLVIGIFLAYDPYSLISGIIKMTPPAKQAEIQEIFNLSTYVLRRWLLGQILSMCVIGIFTSLGLWLLNVPLALTLGIIAALLNFIPNIGPLLSAIPAILIALIQGPLTILYVIILYFIIQFIESYILVPIIQEKALALPSVLLIIAQLLMAVLAGILGLALATPLVAILAIIIKKFYIEDILHEES